MQNIEIMLREGNIFIKKLLSNHRELIFKETKSLPVYTCSMNGFQEFRKSLNSNHTCAGKTIQVINK